MRREETWVRYLYGGGVADWTFVPDGVDVTVEDLTGQKAVVVKGVSLTFWSDETAGEQYADLTDINGNPISTVTVEDGTGTRALGQVPPFYGPDEITEMWAQAGTGPRTLMSGRLGLVLQEVQQQAATTAAQLAPHLGASNPHSTATGDLVDVDPAPPGDGQILVFDADTGRYVPTSATGLDPTGFVKVIGGSTIQVPNGDTTTVSQTIRVPAGDRAAAVNTFEVFWNAGTDGAPNWQLVTALGPYGELRVRPSSASRVAVRVQQHNGSQAANLAEYADHTGVVMSWVDAQGRMRAPNLGITPSWAMDTASAVVGEYRWYNPTGTALTLRGFLISCGGTVGAGGDTIINPKLDGAALYSSGNRPRLAAGARTSGLVTALSTTVWPAGSYLTVDVDSVPGTPPTKVHIQAVAY